MRADARLTKIPGIVVDPGASHGGSLQGYLTMDYAALEEALGEPWQDCEKTGATWILQLPSGFTIEVYDWCSEGDEQHAFAGRRFVKEWHLGACGREPIEELKKLTGWPIRIGWNS